LENAQYRNRTGAFVCHPEPFAIPVILSAAKDLLSRCKALTLLRTGSAKDLLWSVAGAVGGEVRLGANDASIF
jgi:hypothetical protein